MRLGQNQKKPGKAKHGNRYSVAEKLAVASMADSGLSQQQIANINNVKRTTVYRILHDPEIRELRSGEVDAIKKGLINLGYKRSWEAMKSIDDHKLSKSSAVQSAVTSKICMEISRLMEDKSTSNVSHRGLLESISSDRERIMQEIQALSSKSESASFGSDDVSSAIT